MVLTSAIAYGQRQSDAAANVAPQQRVYTRAESGGRTASQLVTETRSLAPDVRRPDTTLLLPGINERLRETVREELTARQVSPEVVRHEGTTATADGGSYTVEEMEARSRVSPNDPMRVVRRTVTTVSPGGRDEWVTERQIFEADPNGRLVRIE